MGAARAILLLWLAATAAIFAGAVGAASIVQAPLRDTVRQADAIVVGTVVSRESRWGDASHRWMQTDYTLAVEDVIFAPSGGLSAGKTIVLTYWGGTIGGETQEASDIRAPAMNERVMVMLHDRWAQRTTLAPTVGFNQGLFTVAPDGAVRDADGRQVTMTSGGELMRGDAAPGAAGVDLAAFSRWLRSNVATIKREAPPKASKADPSDPRILPIFAKTPAMPVAKPGVSAFLESLAPRDSPPAETAAGVPAAGGEVRYSLATELAQEVSGRNDATRFTPKYSSSRQAHAPIVVNNYPDSFAPWSPEDEYQMSKWNFYATNLFRVYTTPTGTYAWPDNVFDLAGWPSDADLVRVYGSSWYCGSGCTTLGVTFTRWDGNNWIVEGDLALNPAVSWTLDDEWVFDGSSATGFRQTFIHELGHMHGLNHNFGFLALMNYFQPNEYRHYGLPFMDDAAGVRAEYPANAAAVTDLAVYLFYETRTCFDGTNFFTCIAESTFPGSVNAGTSFVVNNYHVENPGTTTINTPTIEWYLTTARNYGSSYYYLGTTTYPTLQSFHYFTPSTVGRSLTVPSNVPAGNYYLNAFIRNDSAPGQGSFPFSNNYAFSRTKMFVKGTSFTALTSSSNPSNVGQTVTFTATVTGSSPTGNVTFRDGASTICGSVTLLAGHASCSTNALAFGSHSITATYNGNASNVASTSSTLTQVVQSASGSGKRRDFNGDGKSDLVWRSTGGASALWLMNGAASSSNAVVMPDPSWTVTHTGDMSGDGKADIVWRNAATGQTAAWLMNGLVAASSGVLLSDATWSVQRVGDFNGDGRTDLVWRRNTGETAMWLMNGLGIASSAIVLSDPNWTVADVGDFNGDGKTDLVWRNTATGQTAIWLMNGTAMTSGAVIMGDPNWSVTRVGDFNGDGRSDLVWRHAGTGQTALWLMNGTAMASSAVIMADANWSATHVGDFNGDGKADLAWRNAATGQTAIWLMNGTAPSSSAVVLSVSQWSVVGTPDTNGDAKSDLVWRNAATGEHAIWLMNGTGVTSSAVLSGNSSWLVQSPGGSP